MSSRKKAQIAIEYMLLMGMAIVIAMICLIIAGLYFQDKLDDKNYDMVRDFALSIQNELILGSEMLEGYIRAVNLPNDLNGLEYTISNTNLSLTINYSKGSITVLTPLTNGTLTIGDNTIRTRGGIVYIN